MSFTVTERNAFKNALALAQGGAASPAQAATNAGALLTALAKANIGMQRRTTATKLYSVGFGGAQVVVTSGVVAGIPFTPFTWPEDWHVVGMKAMVNEGYTLLSHVRVALQDQNSIPQFLTSSAGSGAGAAGFVSFANLVGPYDPSGYIPLDMYVEANKSWQYSMTSGDTSGNATYTPELVFLVEPWNKAADPVPLTTAQQ